MASTKISALAALAVTPADGDLFALVDVDDPSMAASGTTKKFSYGTLKSTFWNINGNAVGSEKYIGTNDDFGFAIYTNGQRRVTVNNLGRVGIGITSADTMLDIQSSNDSSSNAGVLKLRNRGTGLNYLETGLIFNVALNTNPDFDDAARIYLKYDSSAANTGRLAFQVRNSAAALADVCCIKGTSFLINATATFAGGPPGGKLLAIGNTDQEPASLTENCIKIFSIDSDDNAATLGLFLEQAVEAVGVFTPSHKLKVKINGTLYHIQLDQV